MSIDENNLRQSIAQIGDDINLLKARIGELNALNTSNKSNLVGAINDGFAGWGAGNYAGAPLLHYGAYTKRDMLTRIVLPFKRGEWFSVVFRISVYGFHHNKYAEMVVMFKQAGGESRFYSQSGKILVGDLVNKFWLGYTDSDDVVLLACKGNRDYAVTSVNIILKSFQRREINKDDFLLEDVDGADPAGGVYGTDVDLTAVTME